jgi:hypothetical protein
MAHAAGDSDSRSAKMGTAPKLLHMSDNGGKGQTTHQGDPTTSKTFVNVLQQFPWHNSPYNSITTDTTPYIDMIEHNITANPMLNQIAANLSVMGNSMDLKEIVDEASSYKDDDSAISAWKQATDALDPQIWDQTVSGNTLFPYNNMYSTKPTGFRYVMPYFSKNHHQVANAFTTDAGETGSGMGGGALGTGMNLAEGAANAFKLFSGNLVEPGSYIEKSKFYSFAGRERSYQFQFPISNCRISPGLSEEATISRNWQLMFLLIYQNSPNRCSRDLILPPCIYEAHIPGIWYSKYAFISQLNVEFLGTRRLLPVTFNTLPEGDTTQQLTTIDAIIPDVYQVTITLTEMVGESQNMLYHMSKGQDVITTGNPINNKGPDEINT